MAKKITGYIKLQLPAGEATPAPPVGPALGQHGVNIMEFVKQFNAKSVTAVEKGTILPVVITVFADRSFSFILKTPPAAVLIQSPHDAEAHFGLAGSEQNPQTCAVFEGWRTLQRAQSHCQPMRHLQATWRNQRHAAAQVAHFDPAQIDRNPLARLGGRRLLAMDLDCPHPEPAPRRQQFERIATGNRGPAQRAGDDSAVPGYSKSAVYGEVCNAAGAARRLVPDQCEQGLA